MPRRRAPLVRLRGIVTKNRPDLVYGCDALTMKVLAMRSMSRSILALVFVTLAACSSARFDEAPVSITVSKNQNNQWAEESRTTYTYDGSRLVQWDNVDYANSPGEPPLYQSRTLVA